jgi:hypothetical protein
MRRNQTAINRARFVVDHSQAAAMVTNKIITTILLLPLRVTGPPNSYEL